MLKIYNTSLSMQKLDLEHKVNNQTMTLPSVCQVGFSKTQDSLDLLSIVLHFFDV